MNALRFSLQRCLAILKKEFMQMRRDRLTFAMIVGIPIIQLTLFGFAINTNPKHLPTALVMGDYSPYTRQLIKGLENTEYFKIIQSPKNIAAARELIKLDKALFVVSIPPNFTRDFLKNARPQLLVEADATDPVASGTALSTLPILLEDIFDPLLKGNFSYIKNKKSNIELVIHSLYNPESITQYNIVPGLLGVVLTMTMVLITSLAITRERERGTMENLLATPVQPLEVMLGKIFPYIIVGYIQICLILLFAFFIFHVPMEGSIVLLLLCALPFIAANLAVGLTFSSVAANQLQAMQMAFFYFLPSILLSGFMFPFAGLPAWARVLSNLLPLTHFLRIVRGILLKGNGIYEAIPNLWPILLFACITLFIGVNRYRRTLD